MNNIPRIAHFYWGGGNFAFLRYLTIKSFRRFHPEWKVIIHVSGDQCNIQPWATKENSVPSVGKDYLPVLVQEGVEIHKVDMTDIGFSNQIPEVLKSDIYRLYLLATTGGLYLDTDVLFFRAIQEGLPHNDAKAFFNYHLCNNDLPYVHRIGLLAASENNPLFGELFNNVKPYVDVNSYQCVGSHYYGKFLLMDNPDICNFSVSLIYPFQRVEEIFEFAIQDALLKIAEDTVAVHWFAGNPKAGALMNTFQENTYLDFDNILAYYTDKLLSG